SSLVDEWERMRDPAWEKTEAAKVDPSALRHDITTDEKAFLVLVRNELFRLLRALSSRDWETAAALASGNAEDPWSAERIEKAMEAYWAEHASVRTDPAARDPKKTLLERSADGAIWHVQQIITDPDDDNDWVLAGDIDLDASAEAKRPVFALRE